MCADSATVADGKLYVHGGGWNDLMVDSVPVTYPAFSLVFALELDGSEPEGRLPLEFTIRGHESPVATARGWIDIPPGGGRGIVTNQVTFTMVPLPVAGPYVAQISLDGQELGGVTFGVHSRAEPVADEHIGRVMAESHAARRRTRP